MTYSLKKRVDSNWTPHTHSVCVHWVLYVWAAKTVRSLMAWILTFSTFWEQSLPYSCCGKWRHPPFPTALLRNTAGCPAERDFSVHFTVHDTESPLDLGHNTWPGLSKCSEMFVGQMQLNICLLLKSDMCLFKSTSSLARRMGLNQPGSIYICSL